MLAIKHTGVYIVKNTRPEGDHIEPGCSAAILVYENAWAAPFAAAVRRSGAQLVASGRIPVNAIIAALDELEEVES